jgi:hypothetical protein
MVGLAYVNTQSIREIEMIPERYKDIIKKLSQRTNDGQVNWKPTSNEKMFVVDFRQFSLSISSYRDGYDNRDYVGFGVLDSEGRDIDDFRVGEGEAEWVLADNLYNEARRKARNIDLVIGDITEELKSEGPVGEKDITSESKD